MLHISCSTLLFDAPQNMWHSHYFSYNMHDGWSAHWLAMQVSTGTPVRSGVALPAPAVLMVTPLAFAHA